jgi:hypothetical protein
MALRHPDSTLMMYHIVRLNRCFLVEAFMKCIGLLPLLSLTIVTALFGQVQKTANKSPEATVVEGIKRFDERMRSPDQAVREAEFDAVMADRKVLEALFGDDARFIWPRYEQGLKAMRSSTDRLKEQLEQSGPIKSVEAIDVRAGRSPAFERVLPMIRKDVPVYRAAITYEKVSTGSSAYVVIDGKMRLIRGLDTMPDAIEREKAGK